MTEPFLNYQTTNIDNPDDLSFKTDECNFCEREFLPDTIRMQCHQCKDFDLCVDCYTSHVEHKLHRPDHLMYVRTDYDFVIWPDGFTLHDDILLLEAIEIHGIGSWKEIQDYMHRPQKESIEIIIKHFNVVYGQGGYLYPDQNNVINTNMLPDLELFQNMQSIRQFSEDISQADEFDIALDSYFQNTLIQQKSNYFCQEFLNKLKLQSLNMLSDPLTQKLPETVQINAIPSITGEGSGTEFVVGAWCKRHEFSYEYINKAEYPLMYLRIEEGNETKETMQMKLKILQAYANRLTQRQKRKRHLFMFGSHLVKKNIIDDVILQIDKEQLKCLGRDNEAAALSLGDYLLHREDIFKFEQEHPWLTRAFDTRIDFRLYAADMIKERQIRDNIFMLQVARTLGYTTLNRIGEVMVFLKNPEASNEKQEAMLKRFPPGVVLFFNNVEGPQLYTLDNINQEEAFVSQDKIIEKENQLAQHIAKNVKNALAKLGYENLTQQSLSNQIIFLLKNFSLVGVDSPADVLVQIGAVSTPSSLRGLSLQDLELFVMKLDPKRKRCCRFCDDCYVINECCGNICMSSYLLQLLDFQSQQKKLCNNNIVCKCPKGNHLPTCFIRNISQTNMVKSIKGLPNMEQQITIFTRQEIEESKSESQTQLHNSFLVNSDNFYNMCKEFLTESSIRNAVNLYQNQQFVQNVLHHHRFKYLIQTDSHQLGNRVVDMVLHLFTWCESQNHLSQVFTRSGSGATNIVVAASCLLYFLMVSASTSVQYRNALQFCILGVDKSIQINQIPLDVMFLFLGVFLSTAGQTVLTKNIENKQLILYLLSLPQIAMQASSLYDPTGSLEMTTAAIIGSASANIVNILEKQIKQDIKQCFAELLQKESLNKALQTDLILRELLIGGSLSRFLMNLEVHDNYSDRQYVRPIHACCVSTAMLKNVNINNYGALLRQFVPDIISSISYKSQIINNFLTELNSHNISIIKQNEVQFHVNRLFRQRLADSPKISCQSTQYYKNQAMFYGCVSNTTNIQLQFPICLSNIQQQSLMLLQFYIPETDPVFNKRSERLRGTVRTLCSNPVDSLLSFSNAMKLNRTEYRENRIRLFQNEKVMLMHVLTTDQLNEALKVLSAVVTSMEFSLNNLVTKNSGQISNHGQYQKNLLEVFPNDQISTTAQQIDQSIPDLNIIFPNDSQEIKNFNKHPISKQQSNIMDSLKRNNLKPENFCIVDPLDLLFGPKLLNKQICEDDKFHLLRMQCNVRKIKQIRTGPSNKGRNDQAIASELVAKYITRGELALCAITNITISDYVNAKVSFVSNGYILTNHIIHCFQDRPGAAEMMAYLTLAQLASPDRSVVPDVGTVDVIKDQFEWASCTAERVFQNFVDMKLAQDQKNQEIKTKIRFSYQQKPLKIMTNLTIPIGTPQARIQGLVKNPGSIMVKASEIKSIDVADQLQEKFKQIINRTKLFADFVRAGCDVSAYKPVAQLGRSVPRSHSFQNKQIVRDECYQNIQTDRSWYQNNKIQFQGTLQLAQQQILMMRQQLQLQRQQFLQQQRSQSGPLSVPRSVPIISQLPASIPSQVYNSQKSHISPTNIFPPTNTTPSIRTTIPVGTTLPPPQHPPQHYFQQISNKPIPVPNSQLPIPFVHSEVNVKPDNQLSQLQQKLNAEQLQLQQQLNGHLPASRPLPQTNQIMQVQQRMQQLHLQQSQMLLNTNTGLATQRADLAGQASQQVQAVPNQEQKEHLIQVALKVVQLNGSEKKSDIPGFEVLDFARLCPDMHAQIMKQTNHVVSVAASKK